MDWLLVPFALVQLALAVWVGRRFPRAFRHKAIAVSDEPSPVSVSIIIPVLNEEARLPRALAALVEEASGTDEIIEILVVDGGSTDRTCEVTRTFAADETRIRIVDASPVPIYAAGKAWGLHVGLANARGDFLLTIDADTVVGRGLIRSLARFARNESVDAFSVATHQAAPGLANAMLHPAFLTTLVYRFGPPGFVTHDAREVVANGQCFFASRAALNASNAIAASLSSLCEDITIARTLARSGYAVGFMETDVPVTVEMYSSAAETWANWPRSLAMRDGDFDLQAAVPLAAVLFLQALPLPVGIASLLLGLPFWFVLLQAFFFIMRIGVLFGTRSAYTNCAPTFWLSPLLDLPVGLRLLQMTFKRRFEWRGRTYVRAADGSLTCVDEPAAVPLAGPGKHS